MEPPKLDDASERVYKLVVQCVTKEEGKINQLLRDLNQWADSGNTHLMGQVQDAVSAMNDCLRRMDTRIAGIREAASDEEEMEAAAALEDNARTFRRSLRVCLNTLKTNTIMQSLQIRHGVRINGR